MQIKEYLFRFRNNKLETFLETIPSNQQYPQMFESNNNNNNNNLNNFGYGHITTKI